MKPLWCWRCKAEVPMLDEEEFVEVAALRSEAMKSTKEFRQQWNIPLEEFLYQIFSPLHLRYEQLTGMRNCHQNVLLHHRLSL